MAVPWDLCVSHGSVQVLPGTESLGDQGVTMVLEGPSWPPYFLPQGDRVVDPSLSSPVVLESLWLGPWSSPSIWGPWRKGDFPSWK